MINFSIGNASGFKFCRQMKFIHSTGITELISEYTLKKEIRCSKARVYSGKTLRAQGQGFFQMDGEIGESLPALIQKEKKGVTFVLPKI